MRRPCSLGAAASNIYKKKIVHRPNRSYEDIYCDVTGVILALFTGLGRFEDIEVSHSEL